MCHIVVAGPSHQSGQSLLDDANGSKVTYIHEISEPGLAIADADAVYCAPNP